MKIGAVVVIIAIVLSGYLESCSVQLKKPVDKTPDVTISFFN